MHTTTLSFKPIRLDECAFMRLQRYLSRSRFDALISFSVISFVRVWSSRTGDDAAQGWGFNAFEYVLDGSCIAKKKILVCRHKLVFSDQDRNLNVSLTTVPF